MNNTILSKLIEEKINKLDFNSLEYLKQHISTLNSNKPLNHEEYVRTILIFLQFDALDAEECILSLRRSQVNDCVQSILFK